MRLLHKSLDHGHHGSFAIGAAIFITVYNSIVKKKVFLREILNRACSSEFYLPSHLIVILRYNREKRMTLSRRILSCGTQSFAFKFLFNVQSDFLQFNYHEKKKNVEQKKAFPSRYIFNHGVQLSVFRFLFAATYDTVILQFNCKKKKKKKEIAFPCGILSCDFVVRFLFTAIYIQKIIFHGSARNFSYCREHNAASLDTQGKPNT